MKQQRSFSQSSQGVIPSGAAARNLEIKSAKIPRRRSATPRNDTLGVRWLIVGLMVASLLSACASPATPTSMPTESAAETSPVVSASGEVLPAQWTTLSFAQAGNLTELLVKEGDTLNAGDVIARLDAPDLRAALAQKLAAVKVAEADLAQLMAPPQPADVEAAQQAVKAAQARVAAAAAQRDQLTSAVTAADVLQAQAQVAAAQIQKDKLQEAMDKILDTGGFALAAGEPVANQLKYAELELAAAQAVLTDLQDGPTADQRRMAEAQIGVAAAQVKAAQARLDLLLAGAQTQDVALAKAQVDQAKAEAAQVQAQLDQTQLVSPFDGTVAKVLIDAHQFVGPGVPIVQVADLRGLRIETSDLNENDVARIADGAAAQIRLDALPGVTVTGKVARIDPRAKEGAGVNFTTVIQLDQAPDGLRWGMTANVDIEATVTNASPSAMESSAEQRVSATGKAVPAQKTLMSFALPGTVIELPVETGSVVKRGDVLARLDTALLDAEVAKAEAGLALARASLERISAGPRPEQVAEAQSNLAAAQSAVAQAAANRDQVKKGATDVELDQARTAVQEAYLAMIDARTKRDVLNRDHEDGKTTREKVDDATDVFNVATQNYEAAQARLNKLLAGADADTLRVAQANLSASSAEYDSTQAQVNRLLAGATAEDIAVGEAKVALAQAGLERAQAARAQAEIVAPFDGVIGDVLIRAGQYVNAGTPIVLVGERAGLRVETTDLNEKDVAGIAIGGQAFVTFDALPGLRLEGVVARIAPKSSKTTGVNYTVTIDLAQVPEQLRWGMTAFVDIPIAR